MGRDDGFEQGVQRVSVGEMWQEQVGLELGIDQGQVLVGAERAARDLAAGRGDSNSPST